MKDIYGDKVSKDIWLHLYVEKRNGDMWTIRPHYLEDEKPRNFRDDDPLGDFAIRGYFRDRENLLKYPENKNDLVLRGNNYGYLSPYFVESNRAKMMAKTLDAIRKSLDKQYKTYGNASGFIEDVMRIAVALKAKGFFVSTKSGGWDWASGEYRFMDASQARFHMEHVHREYLKSVFGEEAA